MMIPTGWWAYWLLLVFFANTDWSLSSTLHAAAMMVGMMRGHQVLYHLHLPTWESWPSPLRGRMKRREDEKKTSSTWWGQPFASSRHQTAPSSPLLPFVLFFALLSEPRCSATVVWLPLDSKAWRGNERNFWRCQGTGLRSICISLNSWPKDSLRPSLASFCHGILQMCFPVLLSWIASTLSLALMAFPLVHHSAKDLKSSDAIYLSLYWHFSE